MLKRSIKRSKSDHIIGTNKKTKVETFRVVVGDTRTEYDEGELLEKIVLGGDDIVDSLEKKSKSSKSTKRIEEKNHKTAHQEHTLAEPKPAWNDDNDNEDRIKISEKDFRHKYFKNKDKCEVPPTVYSQTLKTQFEKVTGQPSWAKLQWQKSEDEAGSEDDDPDARQMLQSTGNYLSRSDSLPKNILQIKQCTDANREEPAQCKLKAMEFHPSAQVMLTGGNKQTLALFQIDGKHNPKIQSVHLPGFPIKGAHFSRDGTEVVMTSQHRSFMYYDMIAGRVVTVPKIKAMEGDNIQKFEISPDGSYLLFGGTYGQMHLISTKSKELICSLKMNGTVEAMAFTPDGSKMLSHGDDGEVYVWDMKTRDCIHRFLDDGCVRGTALAISKNGQYIAAGSYSGVVNVYDERCLTEHTPKPLKAVMNLTTPCTNLVFNSTTEILAMASNEADKALRMLHVPSMTVFSNYPDKSSDIKIPHKIDFSLNSGYFCVGNNKGNALLYRVKHYGNY